MHRFIPASLFALLFLLVGTSTIFADPPGRVGRLNYVTGEVSLKRPGDQDWSRAFVNDPLTTSDDLWTDIDSRAEVHIGSKILRLGPQTHVAFAQVDDRTIRLAVLQGEIEVHLRELDLDDTLEVDSPVAATTILRTGDYRFEVPTDDQTIVTTRHGQADVLFNGSSSFLTSGQQCSISGGSVQTVGAPGFDDLEAWAADRTSREERVVRTAYVSPQVIGYEDLNTYGSWVTVPEYGTVWRPPVAYGWAPYRYGHWAWVNPWGWTWVDDAAWGFAPFHYGRWAYVSNGWYWVPGPVVRRPVYAPALVAFVGGNHFGVSVGFGRGIGWFPLGPRDYYRPSYRVSPTYVRNVNVTNVTNITNVTNVYNTRNHYGNNGIPPGAVTGYQNQGVPNAVTAVASNNFVPGKPVQSSFIAVPKDIAKAPLQPVAAPAAPVGNRAIVGTTPVARPKREGAPVIATAVAGTKNGAVRGPAAMPKDVAKTTATPSPSGAKSPSRPVTTAVPPAANHTVANSKPVAKPPVSGKTITNADIGRRSESAKTENTPRVARPHPPTTEHNTRRTPTGEDKTSQPKKTGESSPPVSRANAFTNSGMSRRPSIPRASFAPSQASRSTDQGRPSRFNGGYRPTVVRSTQPGPSRSFGRSGGGGHSGSRGSGGGHRRG